MWSLNLLQGFCTFIFLLVIWGITKYRVWLFQTLYFPPFQWLCCRWCVVHVFVCFKVEVTQQSFSCTPPLHLPHTGVVPRIWCGTVFWALRSCCKEPTRTWSRRSSWRWDMEKIRHLRLWIKKETRKLLIENTACYTLAFHQRLNLYNHLNYPWQNKEHVLTKIRVHLSFYSQRFFFFKVNKKSFNIKKNSIVCYYVKTFRE